MIALSTALHQQYMSRCLALAKLGNGWVAPNPMVGAVLVYDNRIIGEGYHEKYGGPHAEVNCIDSVNEHDESLIPKATLYVSLEPCAHFGKTPPCANLIIEKGIKKVVIGFLDPFEAVNGRGIDLLKHAGIEVITKVLEQECILLNKHFFTFHILKRPYVILKWAQSRNSKIAQNAAERTLISNDYSNKLVHQWRSEVAAILVGTNTAILDNPSLTVRMWQGKNPVRMYIDKHLKLPATHHLLDGTVPTIIFNTIKAEQSENLLYVNVKPEEDFIDVILSNCYQLGLQSILVEGGKQLLQSFIDKPCWDEAIVIQNNQLHITDGVDAPQLFHSKMTSQSQYLNDTITHYVFNNL
jgi:diaminohydroxyphosphoribosylaminopyrimidine deaminase/5-amino-6-(5-phosphoribosylamino)uracil reductase